MEKIEFEYKIIYSRRRSIAISVGPESGVIVRAPRRALKKDIDGFIEAKSQWIIKHLNNQPLLTRIKLGDYKDGDSILFHGNSYNIRIIPSDKNRIEITGVFFDVYSKDRNDKEKLKLFIDRWFKDMAGQEFPPILQNLLTRFGGYNFLPSRFTIRTMKRRWGSCSTSGNITINSELIKLDEKFTEYVMLHELCHLKHPNHSHHFYKLLSEVYPAWKSVRHELKQYIG